MASKSKDNTRSKSGHDSVHGPDHKPDSENQCAGDTADNTAPYDTLSGRITPAAENGTLTPPSYGGGNAANAEDEELLQMLEQLSETIDTAHHVLAEQDISATEAQHDAPPALPEFTPQPLPLPARRGSIFPMLAASAGVLLGVGALTAFWLLWNPPPSQNAGKLVKAQDHIAETMVARRAHVKAVTPSVNSGSAAMPNPPAASQSASAAPHFPAQAPPAPVTEPEPPGDEPAAMAGQAATAMKEAPRMAAVQAEEKPELPPLTSEQETRLLERGKTLTNSGDVASARLTLEYAAVRNSVNAMFALAQTFDPEMLAAWGVIGIGPDMSAAQKWYRRAAELGHDQAGTRMRDLERLISP